MPIVFSTKSPLFVLKCLQVQHNSLFFNELYVCLNGTGVNTLIDWKEIDKEIVKVPDHSVLSRFRSELTEKKAFDRLLKKINR